MSALYNEKLDRMYLLISALQKSVRWCEVNDARFFSRELIEMGMPGAPLNRLMLIAAEDVGLADPTLLKYVGDSVDTFETMLKECNIPKSKVSVSGSPEICAVIDRAAIASALSYKSRVLPMLSFATLFEIYKREDFSNSVGEYENRLRAAIQRQDEKEAGYYAYVLALFLDSERAVLEIAQGESGARNTQLIDEWTHEYMKEGKEKLVLAGIISLLCRDLGYDHGEYRDQVSAWLSQPIKEAMIPDRAYDMHTSAGKKKGRGLKHFFDEAGSVKNERFPNDWEEPGKKAYFEAQSKGLARASKVIEAIKKRLKKTS
jgi:hypothetical protein